MKKLQQTAKALFKKVYNYQGIVTTSVIKAKFPKFKASLKEHWEFLILKMLGRNAKANKIEKQTPSQVLSKKLAELPSDFNWSRPDYLLGVEVRLSYKRFVVGSIGYSNIHHSWYYSLGNIGLNRYCSFNEAFMNLIQKTDYQYNAA